MMVSVDLVVWHSRSLIVFGLPTIQVISYMGDHPGFSVLTLTTHG